MGRLMRPWHCALALALGFLGGPARGDEAIARLAEAVASHPDDPDLLFALARELAASDRKAEAVLRLETLVERWPAFRAEAPLLLGRLHRELGDPDRAVPALERALVLDPDSGAAHLLLGLCLQELGREGEAEPHFEAAAERSPELRGEAWLLAGLSRLERGDRSGGDELLARVIADDPESESARSARLVLEGVGRRRGRLHLHAYAGVEYDSNVTLDSGDDFTGLPLDQSDVGFVWGSAVSYDLVRADRGGVSVGALYDQSAHLELDEWDMQQFGGVVSSGLRLGERLASRLDGRVAYALRDSDPYLLSGGLRPSLIATLGERAGWLRAFAGTDWYEYDETPFTPALERDGFAWGGGLEHVLPIPRLRSAAVSLRGTWQRYESQAERDELLGFEGDYDHDAWGAAARVYVPLPWRFSAEWGVAYQREAYAHPNLIDALTDEGVGTATPSRRRDRSWETALRLSRPVSRFLDVEGSAGYFDQHSNVDVYDYDRWVTGLLVRVHTP
jgi:tetratricopeptide (TPR) repeat protein